ncbi:hypothetical protein AVEN_103420-1, partial [Araneus ventricosus]
DAQCPHCSERSEQENLGGRNPSGGWRALVRRGQSPLVYDVYDKKRLFLKQQTEILLLC